MADKTITELTATTSAATADEIPIWVAGSAVTRKITKANFLQGAFTGGGTVATGGNILTVPASGTAALLGITNTFTNAMVLSPDAVGTQGLKINMLASNTGYPLWITQDGNNRLLYQSNNTTNTFTMYADDYGGDNGSGLQLGRDTNASLPSPAYILSEPANGTSYYLWVDNNGLYRIHTAQPANATESGGTVVGSQSSSLAAKNIVGEPMPIDAIQAAVRAGAEAVRRFTYKSGAFGGEEFSGVVTDYAPRYGMDRDNEHPAGKSLNLITAIGDLLMVVANLSERVAALEEAAS